MSANEGIQVYGGSINVGGSLAVGAHASAVSHVDAAASQLAAQGHADVAARLSELSAAIERDRGRLADAEAALAQLKAAAEELARPQPSRSRVASMLSALKESLGPAAEAAAGLVSLEQVIAGLF
jgi:hypothetical protein